MIKKAMLFALPILIASVGAKAEVITFGCASPISCTLAELQSPGGGQIVIDGLLFNDFFTNGSLAELSNVRVSAIQQGSNVVGLDIRPINPNNNPFVLDVTQTPSESGHSLFHGIGFGVTPTAGKSIDGTISATTFVSKGRGGGESFVNAESPLLILRTSCSIICNGLTEVAGGNFSAPHTTPLDSFIGIESNTPDGQRRRFIIGVADEQLLFLLSPVALLSVNNDAGISPSATLSSGQTLVFPLPRVVPEPSSMALLAAGLVGLAFARRRNFRI